MILDADAPAPLSAAGVTHELPVGRSLVTFDYMGDVSVERIVPLPDPVYLVSDPHAFETRPSYRTLVGGLAGTALLTHDRRTGSASLERLSRESITRPLTYEIPEAVDTVLASSLLTDLLLGVGDSGGQRTVFAVGPGERPRAPLLTLTPHGDDDLRLWNMSRTRGQVRMLIYGASDLRYRGTTQPLSASVLYRVTVSSQGLDHAPVVDLSGVRLDGLRTDDASALSLALNVPAAGLVQLNDHTVFNASPHGQTARHIAYRKDPAPDLTDAPIPTVHYVLYPSPANGYFNVRTSDGLVDTGTGNPVLHYELIALDGRRVLRGQTGAQDGLRRTFRIGLRDIAPGAYIVNVRCEGLPPAALKLIVVR